jgi:p-hydroxybenzoate 3-monooxygenase
MLLRRSGIGCVVLERQPRARRGAPAGGRGGVPGHPHVRGGGQALVRNLIRAFIEDGGDLRFEAADVALDGTDTERPVVRYVGADGAVREIACDFVAGCDGDHGVTNASVPGGAVTVYEHDYGITWLAVQAEAPLPRHALMTPGEWGYAAQYFRGHLVRQRILGDGADSPGAVRIRRSTPC